MRISQVQKIQNLPLYFQKDHEKMPQILESAVRNLILRYQSKLYYDEAQLNQDIEQTFLQIECYAIKSQSLLNNFQSLNALSKMIKDIHIHTWRFIDFLRQIIKNHHLDRPHNQMKKKQICSICEKKVNAEKIKSIKNELVNLPFQDKFHQFQSLEFIQPSYKQKINQQIQELIYQTLDRQESYPTFSIQNINNTIFGLQSTIEAQQINITQCLQQLHQCQSRLINYSAIRSQKTIDYSEQEEIKECLEDQFRKIINKLFQQILKLINKRKQQNSRQQEIQVNFNPTSYLKQLQKIKKKNQNQIKNMQNSKNDTISLLEAQIQTYKIQIKNQKTLNQITIQQSQVFKLKYLQIQQELSKLKLHCLTRKDIKKSSFLQNQKRKTIFKSNNSNKSIQDQKSLSNIAEDYQYQEKKTQKIVKVAKDIKDSRQYKNDVKRGSLIVVHKQERLSGIQAKPSLLFPEKDKQIIKDQQDIQKSLQSNKDILVMPKKRKSLNKKTTSIFKPNLNKQVSGRLSEKLKYIEIKDEEQLSKQLKQLYKPIKQKEKVKDQQNAVITLKNNQKVFEALKVIHEQLTSQFEHFSDFHKFQSSVSELISTLNIYDKHNEKLEKPSVNKTDQKLTQTVGKIIQTDNDSKEDVKKSILKKLPNLTEHSLNGWGNKISKQKFIKKIDNSNNTWGGTSFQEKQNNDKESVTGSTNKYSFKTEDVKDLFISFENAYHFQINFQKTQRLSNRNTEILKSYQNQYLNQLLTLIAHIHLYHPYIYHQVRTFLISPYSSIINQQPTFEITKSQLKQIGLRQSTLYLIVLHRKCLKNKHNFSSTTVSPLASPLTICNHLTDLYYKIKQSIAE